MIKTAKEFGEKLDAKKLTDEQKNQINEYRSQIQTLNDSLDTIKGLQEQIMGSKNKTTEERDDNKMDLKSEEFKKLEKRAMGDYFRGKTASKNIKEYRDAAVSAGITLGNATEDTAGNGGISVPLSVQQTIIQKLNETSPVFNMVQKLDSLNGNLRVIRETDSNDDGFVGEEQAVKALSPVLAHVDLTQSVWCFTSID